MKRRLVKALMVLVISATLTGCANNKESSPVVNESYELETKAEEISELSSSDLAAGKEDKYKEVMKAESEKIATESSELSKGSESTETKDSTKETESSESAKQSSEATLQTESSTPEPEYTVTPKDKTMYAKKAVNLRVGPSTDYEKGGSLSKGQEVHVIGQASTGWYQLENKLFVSNSYLTDTKPTSDNNEENTGGGTVIITPNPTPAPTPNPTPTPEPTPAPSQPQEDVYTYEIYLLPELMTMVNEERVKNGVHEFVWASDREEDAKARARELVDRFAHRSPGGYASGAECITMYGPSVESIYNAYKRSEMHYTTLTIESYCTQFVSANCVVYVNGEFKDNYNVVMMD